MGKFELDTFKAWLSDDATDAQREEIHRDLADESGCATYEILRRLNETAERILDPGRLDQTDTLVDALRFLERNQRYLVEPLEERMPVGRWHRVTIAAALVAMVSVGVCLIALSSGRSPRPTPPLLVERLDVLLFRGGQYRGTLDTTTSDIEPEDVIEMRIRLSTPGYSHLIVSRPDGTSESLDAAGPAVRNGERYELRARYRVKTAGNYIITFIASNAKSDGSPGPPPWKPVASEAVPPWRFDANDFKVERLGPIQLGPANRDPGAEPPAPRGAVERYRESLPNAAIRVIGFPVRSPEGEVIEK